MGTYPPQKLITPPISSMCLLKDAWGENVASGALFGYRNFTKSQFSHKMCHLEIRQDVENRKNFLPATFAVYYNKFRRVGLKWSRSIFQFATFLTVYIEEEDFA